MLTCSLLPATCTLLAVSQELQQCTIVRGIFNGWVTHMVHPGVVTYTESGIWIDI